MGVMVLRGGRVVCAAIKVMVSTLPLPSLVSGIIPHICLVIFVRNKYEVCSLKDESGFRIGGWSAQLCRDG